jgi:hypothetical protein
MGAQPKVNYNIPAGEIVDSPNASAMVETPRKAVPAAPALTDAVQPGASVSGFDGSSTEGWQGINQSNITWVAREDRLQQSVPDLPSEQTAMFVSKDSNFTDGSVETYFYATAGSPLGIVLRGSATEYYRVTFHMNVNTNNVSKAYIDRVSVDANGIEKKVNLGSADFSKFQGYSLETWTLARAAIAGNRITVSINGTEIMSATDSTGGLSQGWAGIWTQSDNGTQFDNIRIQRTAVR